MIRHVFNPPAPVVRSRFWLALCVALILLVCSIRAHADTVTATGTYPTTANGGTVAIPATGPGSLTQAIFEYGTCNASAFGTVQGQQTITPPANSATFTLAPGAYCFRFKVLNTYGVASAYSNVIAKTIAPPTPDAGTLTVIVTVSITGPVSP